MDILFSQKWYSIPYIVSLFILLFLFEIATCSRRANSFWKWNLQEIYQNIFYLSILQHIVHLLIKNVVDINTVLEIHRPLLFLLNKISGTEPRHIFSSVYSNTDNTKKFFRNNCICHEAKEENYWCWQRPPYYNS